MNATAAHVNPLEAARAALAEAAARSDAAVRRLRKIESEISALSRSPRQNAERLRILEESHKQAQRDAKTARTDVRGARDATRDRLGAWLPKGPEDEAARLSAQYPIVFLPVRLETRFDRGVAGDAERPPRLLVRIYPDEIAGSSHEPTLTPAQYDAGVAFWTTAWDATKEALAWRTLVALYPSTRAAWIVNQTAPLNIASRGTGVPLFNPPSTQPSGWMHAVESHVMPDRWHIQCYRGGKPVASGDSAPVRDPLALTVEPSADATDPNEAKDLSGQGLVIDHEAAWMLDFEAALKAGMALSVKIDAIDLEHGFDEVLVVGLKGSLSPAESSKRLAALFEGHHYTRGFAFVPQGTPTNNTSTARSGVPPEDTGGVHSLAIERGASLSVAGGSGRLFTGALGLPDSLTEHVEFANLDEQARARNMAEALWPCTFGYFLRQMMHPVFGTLDIDRAYRWFVDRVRGRGPLPAFRVGNTPYGLLPAVALSRWKAGSDADVLEQGLGPGLQKLVGLWSPAAAGVPRIGRTSDADADLLATLGLDASSRGVRVRAALGPTAQFNAFSFLGIEWNGLFDLRATIAKQLLADIGHPEWDPTIAWMTFDETAQRFFGSMVAAVLAETPGSLDPNYITWIAGASVAQLQDETLPFPRPRAFLYHMLRHAALVEYSRIADSLLLTELSQVVARPDEELVGFKTVETAARATAFERLAQKIPSVTGTLTLAEYLVHPQRAFDKRGGWNYRQTLTRLASLPSAELDRLFGETLDVCSHRVDAWVTSLASKRLADLRSRVPTGCYLGAYARVENLRPVSANEVRVERNEDGREILAQVDNGGFIHAPTMTHANAAAVLRNAFLTRSGENAERYRIDLSSERVRRASFVLDAVRAGQPLGAVLGYQFERGLHEGHPGRELNKFIDVFRSLYPLVANKADDSAEAAEAVAARNVVDGVRLRAAWRAGSVPFGTDPRLPGGGDDRTAIEAELRSLDDTADALADLLMSESVFQLMRGNLAGASASFDSMAAGVRPPDPEIARQSRGGTTVTHRFGVVLGAGLVPPASWVAPDSPRSSAEPHLDAWVGTLLGDPQKIRCQVDYRDPQPGDPAHRTRKPISLADLKLRPLDFLAIGMAPEATGGASELDLRIVASAGVPDDADVRIDHANEADRSFRSFPEAIEIATSLRNLIGGARPLLPEDLLPPESGSDASSVVLSGGTRGSDARSALGALKIALSTAVDTIAATAENSAPDLTELRKQLIAAASFGVAGAFPSTFNSTSKELRAEFLDRGRTTLRELTRRHTEALAQTAEDEIARSVFGRGFVFLPEFTPTGIASLGSAIADSAALAGNAAAPLKWFQRTAPVRPALRRWKRMESYAQVLGASSFSLDVLQLPYAAGAKWVALPFADETQRPPDGRVSIVLHRAAKPAAGGSWAGLIVDEWSEIIPGETEQTAIAFHYDDPGAEAAQAVLIAVPPTEQQAWDFQTIVDTVRETFELARLRGADLENLGMLGQLLPAIFLASNPAGHAISTTLQAMLQTNTVIAQA